MPCLINRKLHCQLTGKTIKTGGARWTLLVASAGPGRYLMSLYSFIHHMGWHKRSP